MCLGFLSWGEIPAQGFSTDVVTDENTYVVLFFFCGVITIFFKAANYIDVATREADTI